MKRLFITVTIALSFISFSSFANDDENIAPAALESFKTSFKSATEVNWSISENYFQADFALNGQYVSAFYDAEGKMIAMSRNISSLQLPLTLQASLKNKYEGYWISGLMEMSTDDGTSYYITLENADSRVILKSVSNTDWSHFKKLRKS